MSPADRALKARELQDYPAVVRCFDPQRQRASQVVPLDERQLRTIVDRPIYLTPQPSRWHRAGVLVAQTLAWASLVATGVLCLVATLVFLWGVTQAFALLLRVLLRLVR